MSVSLGPDYLHPEPSSSSCLSGMLSCSGWSGHVTLILVPMEMPLRILDWKCCPLIEKGFLLAPGRWYTERGAATVMSICHGCRQKAPRASCQAGGVGVRPPLICDSSPGGLTVRFHRGSDTVVSEAKSHGDFPSHPPQLPPSDTWQRQDFPDLSGARFAGFPWLLAASSSVTFQPLAGLGLPALWLVFGSHQVDFSIWQSHVKILEI